MPSLHPHLEYDAIRDFMNGVFKLSENSRKKPWDRESGVSRYFDKRIARIAAIVGTIGLLSFLFYYFTRFGDDLSSEFRRSIAVIPFDNLNNDSTEYYFTNGITEDILNDLTRIPDLNVKSRASTMYYSGTSKSTSEIAMELGVIYVVAGSIRRSENNISIDARLIHAGKDLQIWSETYERDLEDIFAVQSEIVLGIADALNVRVPQESREKITMKPSRDVRAYDYFLRARDIVNRGPIGWTKDDVATAMHFINQSVDIDPAFAQAIALKGRIWYYSSYWGTRNSVWQDSALVYAGRSIEADPSLPEGYKLRADLLREMGKYDEAKKDFKKVHEVAPNNPEFMFDYGIQLLRDKNERGAEIILKSIYSNYRALDPEYYRQLSDVYYYLGDLQAEIKLLEKAKKLDPNSIGGPLMMAAALIRNGQYQEAIAELESTHSTERWILDQFGWAYYLNRDFDKAAEKWMQMGEIEKDFNDSTQTVPYRHRLGMVYLKLGKKSAADSLIRRQLEISTEIVTGKRSMGTWGSLAEAYYDQGICLSHLGRPKEAVQALERAWHYRFAFYWGWFNDPLLENLRGRSDFESVIGQIEDEYGFWRNAFADALKRTESDDQLRHALDL